MNSAPVQLLPVEVRGGSSDSSPKNDAVPVKGDQFSEVFGKTAADTEVRNTERREEAVFRKSDPAKSKKETDLEGAGKHRKKTASEEDENIAASAAAEVEDLVDKLKKSLGSGKKADETDGAGKKSELIIKDAKDSGKPLKSNLHVSLKGSGKTAASEIAGAFPGLLDKNRKGEGDDAGRELKQRLARLSEDSLAGKLDIAAKKAGSSEQKHNFAGQTGIELVALSDAEKSDGDKKGPDKKGKQERTGKLRIVDHRTVAVDSDKGLKSGDAKMQPVSAAENDLRFSGQSANSEPGAASRGEGRTAETRTFQSAIQEQLKDGLNSQIVKQAGIIVKGDGTGEIKLVMKPESLGNVRIQLSLNDNHIAGRIIVENNIVREIFENNLENLYKAFGSEGFENGGLEVSVRGQGGEAGGNGRKNGRGRNVHAVKAMEEAVPDVAGSEWRNNAVNMVV